MITIDDLIEEGKNGDNLLALKALEQEEYTYCKIICDEILGRQNFLGGLIGQKRKGGGNDS